MTGPRRAAAWAAGALLAIAPSVAPAAVGVSDPGVVEVSGTAVFSPNGDGVKDVARIRYTLGRPGPVTVEVRLAHRQGPAVFRVRLGRQSAGRHTWRWDGRGWHGMPVPDASYAVHVLSGDAQGRTGLQVDRRFRVALSTDPSYGARGRDPVVVYPRSDDVRDRVGLVAEAVEREVEDGRLVVRDPQGRVVARTSLRRDGTNRFATFAARLAWQARRPDGRPLPAGNYVVDVRGTDLAGNTASSRPLSVRVSKRVLAWHEESRTVLPMESRVGECDRSTALGCGLTSYCGVVLPSERFVGGLSLRSAVCPDPERRPEAASTHLVTVADAVRGIESYRLGFTGAPTGPDETDPLTLSVGDAVLTSSGAAQTSWLTTGPYLDGDVRRSEFIPPLRPSVQWRASTAGDDSYEVASFTLDLRYLVVAD